MSLPLAIDTRVSRPAIESFADFHRIIGEQPPPDDMMVILIVCSLNSFTEGCKGCRFLTDFTRHSFTGASVGPNILTFHAENRTTHWFVGTPSELPLDADYEQCRVIEESAMILKKSEPQRLAKDGQIQQPPKPSADERLMGSAGTLGETSSNSFSVLCNLFEILKTVILGGALYLLGMLGCLAVLFVIYVYFVKAFGN